MTEQTETPAATEEPTAPAEETPGAQEQQATDFTDADREKLTSVVQKERAAAKSARAAAEAAEKRLAEMEAAETRRTVAEEKSLTPEQAAFLTGDTAEEMAASADALLSAFGDRTRSPLHRYPREVLRAGATGARYPAESASDVADRVLD